MRWFRDLAIGRKLTLVMMLTSSAAVLLVVVTDIMNEVTAFRKVSVRDLSVQAEIIGENCVAALEFDDSRTAQETLASLKARADIVAACVYRKDGTILAGYLPSTGASAASFPQPATGGHRTEGGHLLLFHRIVHKGETVGTVYLRSTMQPHYARLTTAITIAVGAMLVSWILALALAGRLQHIISDPIMELTRVTEEVRNRQDYSLRASHQGDDEIGVLTHGFNRMLANIQERDAKLQEETASVQLLRTIAMAANEASTLEEALQVYLDQICTHTGWPVGHAYTLDKSSEHNLVSTRTWHLDKPAYFEPIRTATEAMKFAPGVCVPGSVLASGKPFWSSDVAADPDFLRAAATKELGLRAIFSVPVKVGDEVLAVLEFFSADDTQPTDQLQEIITLAAVQLGHLIERLRAEAALREFSAGVLKAQDEERRRIARELHDSTGQNLAALTMMLTRLSGEDFSRKSPDVRQRLSECQHLAEVCSHELRTLSYLLHPPLLDERGLSSALRWFVEGFAERSGIRIKLDLSPDLQRLPQEVEMALFRIVQEGLTNTHRHSGGSTAAILLHADQNHVQLEVRDDGKGLSKRGADGRVVALGVGITGMRERVKELNGQMNIDSSARGTTVRVTLPLVPPRHE